MRDLSGQFFVEFFPRVGIGGLEIGLKFFDIANRGFVIIEFCLERDFRLAGGVGRRSRLLLGLRTPSEKSRYEQKCSDATSKLDRDYINHLDGASGWIGCFRL